MATAEERYSNEWTRGKDGTASKQYIVSYDPATEGEDEIEAALDAVVPQFYRGYVFNSIVLREEGLTTYAATARYSQLPSPTDTDPSGTDPGAETSFQVATENVKQMASYTVVASGASAGKTEPDHGGLIGVTSKGVEGIDVIIPTFSFSVERYFAANKVTQAYVKQLAQLVGKVNNANFGAFAAGEVLSVGARGSIRAGDNSIPLWRLQFDFAVSPNVTDLAVGGMTVDSKRGWDYLEIHFEEEEDTTNKVTLKKPYAWTVHQVYQYANFALFGIGV